MQRGERIRLYLDLIATLAIIAASATFVWTMLVSRRNAPADAPSALDVGEIGETLVGVETTPAPTSLRFGQARVVFIEFSDFQCPYCAQYARETYPQIEAELVRPGLLDYVFRHFPLSSHANALAASEMVECAGSQGQYLAMRTRLFSSQEALMPPRLLDYGAKIGLDRAALQRCLADGGGRAQVEADIAEGVRLGVSSTPTFFIGKTKPDGTIVLLRRIRGLPPSHAIRSELQKLL